MRRSKLELGYRANVLESATLTKGHGGSSFIDQVQKILSNDKECIVHRSLIAYKHNATTCYLPETQNSPILIILGAGVAIYLVIINRIPKK